MKKFFIIVLALILFCYSVDDEDIVDDGATEWHGNQKLQQESTDVGQIAIAGVAMMVFVAGKTEQEVNIYNPETNTCLIKFTLYIEDEVLWESGYVEPGKGYYDISLVHPLNAGTYEAYLLYDCYEQRAKVNSARVKMSIVVQ